jgi:hypothetical protein
MRIAIGQRPQSGPWGGGNRFVQALVQALHAAGHEAVYDLAQDGIDLILLTDPRPRNPNLAFSLGDVFHYLRRHPGTLVIHRINECDERKGTRTMNFRLRMANYLADHTVFIASWLADLDLWLRESDYTVVLNGADRTLFNSAGHQPWNGQEPFRLVTHHWGAHRNKGAGIYALLDTMLERPDWRGRLEFTYIGNLPPGLTFRRAQALAASDGDMLAALLRGHHGYVTASINEPAGMHHIEGALCGLPLLYCKSGALPEYCQGFGEAFEGIKDFEAALEALLRNYGRHRQALESYPHDAAAMCAGYIGVFERILAERDRLAGRRKLWRSPLKVLALHSPV